MGGAGHIRDLPRQASKRPANKSLIDFYVWREGIALHGFFSYNGKKPDRREKGGTKEELRMKLAEALQERADLNRRIEQLKDRLSDNAVVQEGEKPAEDPDALMTELDSCIAALEELMGRINLTNSTTMVEGVTLTQLIARKDCLNLKIQAYRNLVREASNLARRATRTEIKILSAVDVAQLQKSIDRMARELRVLDNKIQQTNWSTEL